MVLKPEPEPVNQPPQAVVEKNNPDIFKGKRDKLKENLNAAAELKEEAKQKAATEKESRRNTAAPAPENTTSIRRVVQLINLKADTPTQEQIWKDFNKFGHVEYVRKITDNKSKKTTVYISFTKEDNATIAIDSFDPQKYGKQVKLIYAKIQPAAYDSNKKIINKKGGYYYGKDEYNTPTTVEYFNENDVGLNEGDSVVSWETITPQEIVTNTVSVPNLQSLELEDLINWVKMNAPTNDDKVNLIGSVLSGLIIRIRPDKTEEAAKIVNYLSIANLSYEQVFKILKNFKDEIPRIIDEYDIRKNKEQLGQLLNEEIIKIRPNDASYIVNYILATLNEEQADKLYNNLKILDNNISTAIINDFINEYDKQKNAQVFNNQLNNQNWAETMEEQAPSSKSPVNRGDIANAFRAISKKQ